MSRLSIGTIIISALVGGVLLVAGGQMLVPQITLIGDPATLPTLRETASSPLSVALQLTTEASTTSVLSSPTATVVEHPNVICWSCTPVPTITATSDPVEVSATPALPTATPQLLLPTATQTPSPTRIVDLIPTGGIPGITAIIVQPTATDAIPTLPMVSPSPTAVFPVATGTTVILPTRVITPPSPSANFQLWMSSDFRSKNQHLSLDRRHHQLVSRRSAEFRACHYAPRRRRQQTQRSSIAHRSSPGVS